MKHLLILLLPLTFAACQPAPWPDINPSPRPQERGHTDGPQAAEGAVAAPTNLPQVDVSEEAQEALKTLLDAYDKAHISLTGDRLDGVEAAGATMAESAHLARQRIEDETLLTRLGEVERHARLLNDPDIEKVRIAYGDLSKSLVSIISSVAAAREGRYVFECPMARGYQKWIQREPNLRNPYFGSAMLTCGDESHWTP